MAAYKSVEDLVESEARKLILKWVTTFAVINFAAFGSAAVWVYLQVAAAKSDAAAAIESTKREAQLAIATAKTEVTAAYNDKLNDALVSSRQKLDLERHDAVQKLVSDIEGKYSTDRLQELRDTFSGKLGLIQGEIESLQKLRVLAEADFDNAQKSVKEMKHRAAKAIEELSADKDVNFATSFKLAVEASKTQNGELLTTLSKKVDDLSAGVFNDGKVVRRLDLQQLSDMPLAIQISPHANGKWCVSIHNILVDNANVFENIAVGGAIWKRSDVPATTHKKVVEQMRGSLGGYDLMTYPFKTDGRDSLLNGK